jgi:hypothetical protein
MDLVRNAVEGVKYNSIMMASFVHAADWHSDYHLQTIIYIQKDRSHGLINEQLHRHYERQKMCH